MKFPVDLLVDVDQAELEQSAHNYMDDLLFSDPDSPEHLVLSDSTQVTIDISSVGFVPLYGSSDKQKVLALFSAGDPLTAVALYLLDQWWPVEQILRTADPARDGAVEVESVAERMVLYVLNRVVYRAQEMSGEELPFLCHGEQHSAKILWSHGEAVGFYSVKPAGSLCNSFSTRSYQLPVMDSIFVRKAQRGKGFGLQMLEDFVLSFKEDCLGLRYPLTTAMYKVCEKYLCQYPGDAHLLWEVESVGWPNQRTSIASKIQTLDLSAVSRSLSFTAESLLITEVTEEDVVMEAVTAQIKEAASVECTAEIVEEVTVLRAAGEDEVPVAARGRSAGSKRRKTGEKMTEDKPEKVLRIEDIEAETPTEEQVPAQHKTELYSVSELLHTQVMFSVAPEEKGEDVVDAAQGGGTTVSVKSAAAVFDLKGAEVTSALTTEEPQVDDDLSNASRNSQIRVENVASEIEEAVEERQEENTAVVGGPEEDSEVHDKAETLNKVGKGPQTEVTDEESEERVTQHEVSLSTHPASEDGEAGKTGRTVVKTTKPAESETSRRRSQRCRKPEEELKEETLQDGRKVLRGRTVASVHTPKRKHTRHSQKMCEESEKDEVSASVVEELAVTEGEETEEITSIKEGVVDVEELREEEKQQLEDEQLTNEETKRRVEPRAKDAPLSGRSVELSVVTTTTTSDRTKEHEDEEELTDQADLGAGGSGSRKIADEKATDKQMGEGEETVTKAEEISPEEPTVAEEGASPKAEEATEEPIPSTEVNVEEHKETREEEFEGQTETLSVMEADEEEEADEAVDTADEVPDEEVIPVAEEPQENDAGCEIPKLQKATVVLVDLKTSGHHINVKAANETPAYGESVSPEKAEVEPIAAEKEEQQTPEPEILLLEEDGEKRINETEKDAEAVTVEEQELEENADKKKEESADADEEKSDAEEAVVVETRVLRSGRKSVKTSRKSSSRSNRHQEEDAIDDPSNEKEVDEAKGGAVEVEGETESMAEDTILVTVPVEEKQSAVSERCADTNQDIPVVDDAEEKLPPAEADEAVTAGDVEAAAEADEAVTAGDVEAAAESRALRSGTKTVTAAQRRTTRSRQQVDKPDPENSEEEEEPAKTVRRTPRPRRSRKQIQEEMQKGKEESKGMEETSVEEEEAVKGAAVEEEKTEEEMGQRVQEEAASEREERLEPEMDVEEGKTVEQEGQDVVEEQPEVISEAFAGMEVDASGEEGDEMAGEEVELPPVVVTRSLRSGGKISKSPPKTRPRGRPKKQQDKEEGGASAEKRADGGEPPAEPRILRSDRKSVCRKLQLQKEEEGPKESAEEAEVEEEEAGPGSVKEPPTDGDEEKAPEEEEEKVEKEEPVTVEVESRASEEGTTTVTEVAENTARVQGGAPGPVHQVTTDSAVLTPGEEEAGEPQSEGTAPQLPALQRVSVVLVDLRKETAAAEDGVRVEKTTEEEKPMSEESVNDEEEPSAIESSARRSRKQAVKATSRSKWSRSRQKEEEEEKEAAAEEQQTMDHEEEDTQQGEHAEPELGVENVDTVAVLRDAPEGQSDCPETAAEDNAEGPVGQSANEGKTLQGLAEEVDTTRDPVEEERSASTSEATETAAGERARETPSQEKDTSEDEAPVIIETRVLRSGKKTPRDTTRSGTTKRQDDKQEEEATTGETSTDGDEPVVETRVLRTGRRSAAAATVRCKSKRAHAQSEDEREDKPTQAEESKVEDTKVEAGEEKESRDEMIEEEHEEEDVAQKDVMEKVAVEEEERPAALETRVDEDERPAALETRVDEEESAALETRVKEEERPAALETRVDEEESAALETRVEETERPAGDAAEETDDTDEKETPVVEATVLRSGGKAVKATPRPKTKVRQQEEREEEGTLVETSDSVEGAAAERRVVRTGKRSAPATAAKPKKARKQCPPEEEGEDQAPPAEGEEEEAEQANEEGKMEMEMKKRDEEEEEEEGDASTEEAAVVEKEDETPAAVEETGADSAEVEEAEEEEPTVTEKGCDPDTAEEELEDQSVVAEEEAPAIARRTRGSKRKTSHAATPPRSRRQKDQRGEETPEDEEAQQVDQLTHGPSENTELDAKDQTEPAGQEAGPPAEETADLIEAAGEEAESPSESKEGQTVDSCRTLRGKMKTVALRPKRRSVRRTARVDYRENEEEEEEEGGEAEATADEEEDEVESGEDKDEKKAGRSADEPGEHPEKSSRQENTGDSESAGEKGGVLNLALDTDEEMETAGSSHETEEKEQNLSEEDAESVVIGKRVLRGRSVPSVILTPASKPRRCSARVQKAEESLSDEESSSQSNQRTRLRKRKSPQETPTRKRKSPQETPTRKRKSPEETPTRKSKRHGKV